MCIKHLKIPRMVGIIIMLLSCMLGVAFGAEKDYFTAAVFENAYAHDEANDNPSEVKTANLAIYEIATKVAAEQGADIILFAEYGLFPYSEKRENLKEYAERVPKPKELKVNPCVQKQLYGDRPALLAFSCMAQKHKIYVVGNLLDIQPCMQNTCDPNAVESCNEQSCEDDATFNTEVAFDRSGNLIARYHKNHLYGEVLNTPTLPDMTVFGTEFGVFGMMICFDSVFKKPVELVQKYGVETMLYSTFWYDQILPLNAIEWQQSWALSNKVNFLAANQHSPSMSTLGSGIYSKRSGALVYTYDPDGKSKLLISRMPRGDLDVDVHARTFIISENDVTERTQNEKGKNFPKNCYNQVVGPATDMFDYRCFKDQVAEYTLQRLEGRKGTVKACRNGFCCSATYSADHMRENYYLAVFNGTNNAYGHYKWAEESCLLIRCEPFEGKPCVTFPPRAQTVFDYVELRATFSADRVFPTVSVSGYRLAPKSEWEVQSTNAKTMLRYKPRSKVPLLKVALLGRSYARDPVFSPLHKYS